MKTFITFAILIILSSCSFDQKSGIWNNRDSINKNDDLFSDFKTLASSNQKFNKIVNFDEKYQFNLPNLVSKKHWLDIYGNKTNNLQNYKFNDKNKLIFESKKISKYKINDRILFEQDNLITADKKGNIIIFSVKDNKILRKFNFYQRRFKNIDKVINIIVQNNIIYAADNLGFLYSFDYKKGQILWAKDYKIPYSSNLKITKNYLITANQNNVLNFYNKFNGELVTFIPTEEIKIKNQFKNNLSINEKYTFFLNTYGSLYVIDNKSLRMKWFLNFNKTKDLNPSNLFDGKPIISNEKILIISSADSLYIVEIDSGSTLAKINIASLTKPFLIDNKLFFISKNHLLISFDIIRKEIIFSYDINKKIADFLKIKKKKALYKSLMVINDKLYIFLKNSYFVKISINGEIENIRKLPSELNSFPILVKESMIFINKKNKLSIVN